MRLPDREGHRSRCEYQVRRERDPHRGNLPAALAIDPVALSYLLEGTGPVDVGDGVAADPRHAWCRCCCPPPTKRSTTAPATPNRDAFLARAAGAAFGAVMSGEGDAGKLMHGLEKAAGERRVLVWSTDEAEQADLAGTSLAGELSQDLGRADHRHFPQRWSGGQTRVLPEERGCRSRPGNAARMAAANLR